MKRTATAIWTGSGKDGSGHLTTQSTALDHMQYSYKSRFEQGVGTNPEELIAAAHAGCFAMALSFELQKAGFTAESLDVQGEITLENGAIISSHLVLQAKIPTIGNDQFNICSANAKANCPVSKLLNAAITLDAVLL